MNTKRSATLRYLESHEVFTLEEFMESVDLSVSERTRYTNLQNAVERDQAYRVRRALYASNIGIYRDRVPNVFLVAAKAADDAVLTHHAALEVHGVAHSPSRTVYFTSGHKIDGFAVRGYRFRRVAPLRMSEPGATLDSFVTRARAGEAIVPVSTRERTLVDCLGDLSLAGGLEELLRSLGGFTSMSVREVARYASTLGSPTLTARAGWALELFADRWQVDVPALDEMAATLGRGTYRLSVGDGTKRFVPRWRLYVPADLPLDEWARG